MHELFIESQSEIFFNKPKDWLTGLQQVQHFELLSSDGGVYVGPTIRPAEGEESRDLFVKTIKPNVYPPYLEARRNVFKDKRTAEYLGKKYIDIINLKTDDKLSELTRLLILEHAIHEITFKGFILPARFGKLMIPEQITANKPEEERRVMLLKRNNKKMTEDDREIYLEKGQEIEIMTVPYIKNRQSLFSLDPTTISPELKQQIATFLYQIEDLYNRTGLVPDPKMLRGNEDHLIVVNGKLLLLDTNNLIHDPNGRYYDQFIDEFKSMLG